MSIKKIYPTIQELSTINTELRCSEPGCVKVFTSTANLNFHLAKTHKNEEHLSKFHRKEQNREFYCPSETCDYHKVRNFKSLKLLKQHYAKMHQDKTILCAKCTKGFATLCLKNLHEEYCDVTFNCYDCKATYSSYDTLQTHSRRQKHKILPKKVYKTLKTGIVFVSNFNKIPDIEILLTKSDKSCQTDNIKDFHPKVLHKKMLKAKWPYYSQETQTLRAIKPRICVETQTIGDYFVKKSSDVSNLSSMDSLCKKSTKTQTNAVSLNTKSCNTSFNLSELHIGGGDVEKTSLGTQTLSSLYPSLLDTAVTVDSNDMSYEFIDTSCQANFNDNFDSNSFLNCNSETQTDLLWHPDDLYLMEDYTHMCTQTCDQILSGTDLVLNDIQTQTVADEMLKSVESQTMMSVNSATMLLNKDTTHTETQTDMIFKQMLEEINA